MAQSRVSDRQRLPYFDSLLISIAYKVGSKWGFADGKGKWVIPASFDGVGYFSEGLAAAKIGERWGFINKKGKTVIKPQFQDEPAPFFFEEAMVTIGGRKEYILKSSSPFAYAYSVEISLEQEVVLGRKPNMRTAATTWSQGSVGIVGIANLRAIQETVRGRVNHFIHDYLAANSK